MKKTVVRKKKSTYDAHEKNLLVLIALFALFLTLFVVLYDKKANTPADIPIQETTYKASYINASPDSIVIDLPWPGAVTGKVFMIRGEARGSWYFEGSFPVIVFAGDGSVLWQGPATAQNDWMTEDFVPFTATATIPETYSGKATLLLKKDNPSGEASRDGSVSFPFTIEW